MMRDEIEKKIKNIIKHKKEQYNEGQN